MATTAALGTGVQVPVDMTSRDYLSVRSDLINAIPTYLPEWTTTVATDFGITMIELFAYVIDIENYYIDRVANESFLSTAQQRSSVLNLAYLIDYAPADATPSSAVMTVMQRAGTAAFILPKGSQFSTAAAPNQGSIIFELAQDHSFPANTGTTAVAVNATTGPGTQVYTTLAGTQTLPLATIAVTSGAAMPAGPGQFYVGGQLVSYASVSGNNLTGCSGGVGTIGGGSNIYNAISNPLTVVQGITVYNEALGSSNGNANQTYALFNPGVIDGSVQVFLDEGAGPKPWLSVAHLTDAGPYDAVFMPAVDANGILYVVFGDGSSGRIPNPQALITATYRIGGGAAGNIGANQITADLTGLNTFLSVTNPSPAVGGADAETIAQIQVNAPQSITAAGRCVSIQDFASVALTVPGVSKAGAGVAGTSSAVNLYIHPAGGPYRQADLIGLVNQMAPSLTWGGPGPASSTGQSGYLDSRKMVGTSITVLPPQISGAAGYVGIVLSANVTALPQYDNLQLKQDVLSALSGLFDFGSVIFGQRITLSSVYHTVQGVPGVDFLVVTTMGRSDTYVTGSAGDIVCAFNEIPIVGNPDTGANQINITVTGGL